MMVISSKQKFKVNVVEREEVGLFHHYWLAIMVKEISLSLAYKACSREYNWPGLSMKATDVKGDSSSHLLQSSSTY